jgi:hypothetical protein
VPVDGDDDGEDESDQEKLDHGRALTLPATSKRSAISSIARWRQWSGSLTTFVQISSTMARARSLLAAVSDFEGGLIGALTRATGCVAIGDSWSLVVRPASMLVRLGVGRLLVEGAGKLKSGRARWQI